MATIEPRLIALLNNDGVSEPYNTISYPPSPSLELPPLQDPNILKASGRPLLLEPDASKRNGKLQHATLGTSSHEDDENPKSKEGKNCTPCVPDRALGGSSPQSLRKILDAGSTLAVPSKKRNIVETSKDDFVQLPQPPKKQKAAKQVVPPIIIGLFEPPPQATLFPPIASSSFHDSHGRNTLNIVTPTIKELRGSQTSEDTPNIDNRSASRQKEKNIVKARKKWTEQETKNLLLGVHKHGVGRWTDILDDPSFSFNGRSGVDLKDRFRTCCPEELRKSPPKVRSPMHGPNTSKMPKSSLMSENILIEDDEVTSRDHGRETSRVVGLRKSRAHRKRMEDLTELGIDGPFRKSRRRERRPFTEQDDREILAGYHVYGPAWTRIQRDSKYHLQSRQATDLRDRFRNKFPDKFRPEEVLGRGDYRLDRREVENTIPAPPATLLQSSSSREGLKIHQIISDSEGTGAKVAQFGFKENFTENADGLPPFDWAVNAPFTESIGEMDISRLLLDEPWMDNSRSKEKQPFTGINSILTATADGIPHVPSYYGMLVNDDQIQIPSSVSMDHEASF